MARKYKLMRVTSVLSFVESQWKEFWWRKVGFEAADKISKDSAEFGTRVHKLIEHVLKNGVGSLEISTPNPELACALAVLVYLTEHNITPLFESYEKSLEIEVTDKKLGLVGHFDYAALVDGQPCIVDFKTSKNMRKSFPLQKSAYAKMANKQFGVQIDNGLTIRSHWNIETQTVDFEAKYYTGLIKTYWPIFKACVDVFKYFNRALEVKSA